LVWLKNWANLSVAQRREFHYLMRPSAQLATARALRWREDFHAFYDQHPSYAPEYLRRWCYGAKRCRLQPIKNFVALVENHWDQPRLDPNLICLYRHQRVPPCIQHGPPAAVLHDTSGRAVVVSTQLAQHSDGDDQTDQHTNQGPRRRPQPQ
jgi:hypothetical protein